MGEPVQRKALSLEPVNGGPSPQRGREIGRLMGKGRRWSRDVRTSMLGDEGSRHRLQLKAERDTWNKDRRF